jgi:hypothetical protein
LMLSILLLLLVVSLTLDASLSRCASFDWCESVLFSISWLFRYGPQTNWTEERIEKMKASAFLRLRLVWFVLICFFV